MPGIWVNPTPTMIFVSQSDTCSRLLFTAYRERFEGEDRDEPLNLEADAADDSAPSSAAGDADCLGGGRDAGLGTAAGSLIDFGIPNRRPSKPPARAALPVMRMPTPIVDRAVFKSPTVALHKVRLSPPTTLAPVRNMAIWRRSLPDRSEFAKGDRTPNLPSLITEIRAAFGPGGTGMQIRRAWASRSWCGI